MRLIDADAYEYPGDLVHMPTIDAEPVRHGRWEVNAWWLVCSECGEHGYKYTGFCPNCGAKMDAEPKPHEPRKI